MSNKSKKKAKSMGTWFEVVAHSDALAKNVIEIPSGQRFTVRGPVHEVMVVSIPNEDMKLMVDTGTFEATMDALGTMVRGGGFDGGLLVVPEGLGFMKLQPVDRVTSKLLEHRDQRQRAEHDAQVAKIKREQDEERDEEEQVPSNVTELHPDTKTEGEA